MSYTAEISRSNPTCFIFVIDQSGSMQDPFGSSETVIPKANGVSDAINNLLRTLSIRCAKSEGIRDYFYVSVIGYGKKVGPALSGNLQGKELIPISEISDNPARIDQRTKKIPDGCGGLVDETIKMPIWLDPVADGGTPMNQAMNSAKKILESWLNQYPNSYPPIVIHITDGESTDGDPSAIMEEITNLYSSDGNVLLFNLHLSSNPNAKTLVFPDNSINLPDQYSMMLFNAASYLNTSMKNIGQNEYNLNLSDASKGFLLNSDLTLIITALDIGTRPSNLR